MTRNWDLLRWILNEVESCGGGHPVVITKGIYSGAHYKLDIGEHDFDEVCEHVLLLGDSKLAEVRELGRVYSGSMGVAIDRLTMDGHDFIQAAKDENRWNKAKKTIEEKGGGAVTIGVLTQVLAALLKQSMGLH